jgi:hypothetical protein
MRVDVVARARAIKVPPEVIAAAEQMIEDLFTPERQALIRAFREMRDHEGLRDYVKHPVTMSFEEMESQVQRNLSRYRASVSDTNIPTA